MRRVALTPAPPPAYRAPRPVTVPMTTGTPAHRAARHAQMPGLVSNAWTICGLDLRKMSMSCPSVIRSSTGLTRRLRMYDPYSKPAAANLSRSAGRVPRAPTATVPLSARIRSSRASTSGPPTRSTLGRWAAAAPSPERIASAFDATVPVRLIASRPLPAVALEHIGDGVDHIVHVVSMPGDIGWPTQLPTEARSRGWTLFGHSS